MRLIFFFAFFEKIVVPILTSGGYVGLSLSVLLAQHNQVMAVDIVQAKVDMINNHKRVAANESHETVLTRRHRTCIARNHIYMGARCTKTRIWNNRKIV